MTWTNELKSEIRAIVARIEEIQKARKLSDGKLIAEFPDIGSTKTWRSRLVAENYEGLNPERLLARLRRVNTIIDGGTPDATFYPDLPFATEFRCRLGALERTQSDRRILVTLAPNGTGKTSVARWAVAQQRSARAYCRLRPAWKNKQLHIANGIARALNAEDPSANVAEAEQRLIALLSGQPRTLFLDQAHEGGPALMHLLRALVDETPSRFVYLGYDTAYRRVQTANTDAMIEAQAFIGRCQRPIFDLYKTGTDKRDVMVYLQKSAGLSVSAAGGVANRITSILQKTNNLRLLDDAIDAARAGSEDLEASPDQIISKVFMLAGMEPTTPVGSEGGEE